LSSKDIRLLYYYIDHTSSRVLALRYMEPDDPDADVGDPETDRTETRIDFENWHTVDNVL
jgi:hypothetical protein